MNITTISSILNETVADIITTERAVMKFREDGLREPPLTIGQNNLIIIIMGMAMLIIPVVGFVLWMCVRTKVVKTIRVLSKGSPASGSLSASALPYAEFDSDDADDESKSSFPKRAFHQKDVCVLIQADNVTSPTTPEKQLIGNQGIGRYRPSSNSPAVLDDYSTVDPTFVIS